MALSVHAQADGIVLGGYVQPQVRFQQDSVVGGGHDGFVMPRTRVTASGTRPVGPVDAGVQLEVELLPDPALKDGYVWLRYAPLGRLTFDLQVGQHKVPLGRDLLLDESRLAFVNRPQLATLAPDRQIGATLGASLALGQHVLRLAGGAYNGEGPGQLENADEQVLSALTLGWAYGTTGLADDGDSLATQAAVNVGAARETEPVGDELAERTTLSIDAHASCAGLGASFAWIRVDSDLPAALDFAAQGVNVQVTYLLPLPGWLDRKLELGARWEEIDRNDTVPIPTIGHPDQSQRLWTAVATLYLDGHDLKLQVEASHVIELEDRTAAGADATYPNDTLWIQLTARP